MYTAEDGTKYTGEWSRNKMCGKGKLMFCDGRLYEGEFYDNAMHGKGKMMYIDGSETIGKWF